MWGYIDGTLSPPQDAQSKKYAQELETWKVNNSKTITWNDNSVSQSIGVQLAKYDLSKDIRDHFKKLYVQNIFCKAISVGN